MKRLLCLLLLTLGLRAGAATLGPNLLPSGDFEAGPWRGENDERAAQVDLLVSHGGLQSARLDARPDVGRHVYGLAFDLDPAKRYVLTAWVKCQGVSDPNGVSFWVLQWDDKQPVGWVWNWDVGQGVKELIRTGGTHHWKRFSVLLQKLDPRAKRGCPFFALEKGSGTAWLDDVQVREWDGDKLPPELAEVVEQPMTPADAAAVQPPWQPVPPPAGFDLAHLSFPPREPAGADILDNGNFERLPSRDWAKTVALDAQVKHSGASSLSLGVGDGGGALAATSEVKAGLDYRFTAWVKTENVPPDGLKIRLWPGWWNEATMSENLVVTGGTRDWTRFDVIMDNLSPELAGKQWWLYYSLDAAATGKATPRAWVDDVQIVPLADSLRVTSPRPGSFFLEDQSPALTVAVRGIPAGAGRRLRWVATDFWGQEADRGEAALTRSAAGDATARLPLRSRGYFGCTVLLDDGAGRLLGSATASAAVLPPLSAGAASLCPESIFACWGITPDLAPLLGVKWTRWCERSSDFQPVAGKPDDFSWNLKQWYGDYRPHDARLKERQAGLSTYLCFHSFGDWLLKGPDGQRKPVPPDWGRFADWAAFVYRQVADVVSVVEVWNEPVIPWGWQGTPEDIVTMHRVVYQTVKKINPQVIVLGPCDSTEHLDAFGKLGGFQWVDAVCIHPYRPLSPEATDFVGELRRVREIAARYGERPGRPPKDIWITEMGWTTAPGYFTELEQANWIVRAYVQALAEGVRNLNVHIFRDWNNSSPSEKYYGIVRTDLTPKPAAVAYATLTRNLEGARFVRRLDGLSRASYGYAFQRDGKPVLVLWNAAREGVPERVRVAAEEVTVQRLDGTTQRRRVEGGELALSLGQSPVFVTVP